MRGTKRYSPKTTKKAIDTYKDPYLPKEGLHDMAACTRCHAVYHNKRWTLDETLYRRKKERKKTLHLLCPACQKIRDNFAEGFVSLKGAYLKEHKGDIINIIRNEEERAMLNTPLGRIMTLQDLGSSVEVTTTDGRLAQRIGKKIHRACQGELQIKWTKNKLTRVTWRR
ncbi:MAG: BCAM0308 family protein [Thermodesulfobacteriota bacterium]